MPFGIISTTVGQHREMMRTICDGTLVLAMDSLDNCLQIASFRESPDAEISGLLAETGFCGEQRGPGMYQMLGLVEAMLVQYLC